MSGRLISPEEVFKGDRVQLRLCTLHDCTERYVAWLADPLVARYLETRWRPQTLADVREFVASMLGADHSYLFAIVFQGQHVGNIKVGPINRFHAHADVSYFVGDRSVWGQGIATDAIRVICRVAFDRLGLHRVQAGLYASNGGSRRALEKAGFQLEGNFRRQLQGAEGWEDHLWFGLLRDDEGPLPSPR